MAAIEVNIWVYFGHSLFFAGKIPLLPKHGLKIKQQRHLVPRYYPDSHSRHCLAR